MTSAQTSKNSRKLFSLHARQATQDENDGTKNKLDFLSDIELFNDNDHSQKDFKSELKKRIREMKKRKYNKQQEVTDSKKASNLKKKRELNNNKEPFTVINLEAEVKATDKLLPEVKMKTKKKKKKVDFKGIVQSSSTLNDTKDAAILEDFVRTNLFMSEARALSKDEEKLIEGWRSYSKNAFELRKRQNCRHVLNKLLVGFVTVFLIILFAVLGSAYIVYHFFEVFNSITKANEQILSNT